MKINAPRCYKNVDAIKCICCNSQVVRNGRSATGCQRYKCTACYKNFQASYHNKACHPNTNRYITDHVREGCGIRSIARLLKISPTTILKRIISIAKSIVKPMAQMGMEYELDEICTFVKKKTDQIWVVYAIRRDTNERSC